MSPALLSKNKLAPPSKAQTSSKGADNSLRVGEPDDSFEQEADRVAEEVLAGGTKQGWSLSTIRAGTRVQRKCACGGSAECEDCKEKEKLQRKASGPARTGLAPPIVHEVLNSSGRPLDPLTRRFFEPRFRHDLSHVRVYTDARAAESAKAVDALAYTVGNRLVFGAGQFKPESARGRKLLAHELAHTVQQRWPGFPDHSVVRRAPTPGWAGSLAGTLNAGENDIGNIRRIPIENLKEGNQQQSPGSTESAAGRAIALVNKKFDPQKPADVLLFFHGHNEGLRAGGLGYRDKDVYEIEGQIDAAGKEQVIGILPQGTQDSAFGGLPAGTTPTTCNNSKLTKAFNSDAYVGEVLDTLTTLKIWAARPKVGSVIVSGHSGAGELINQGLLGGGPGSSLPQNLGTLKEVALFDAINGPCEFVSLQDWLEKTLKKELADLSGKSEPEQHKYLKTSIRFRSYYETSKKIGVYYSQWNVGPLPTKKYPALLGNRKPLRDFLDDWFQNNASGLPQTVQVEWKNNYVITYMGKVAHDDDKVNVISAPTPGGSTPVTESINVLPKREAGANALPGPESGLDAPGLVYDALRSSAEPLGEHEKSWAKAHFRHDFSQVRVHLNTRAAESARSLKSFGYTVGEHIVFDPSRYDPETAGGRKLLAHELAHVLQQRRRVSLSKKPLQLRIGSPEDPLERSADYHAEHPGSVAADPAADQVLQRAPAEGQLAKAVCETTSKTKSDPPKEEKGECNYARPENCPTYESWIETFTKLKTFGARATPATGQTGANTFAVLGGGAASRFDAKPDEKSLAKDPNAAPLPTTGLKLGETFIDHPTDAWVKACLPDNLRATAYQLPADCADIAIVLRHVWLSAHHRTQTLRVGKQTWVIGDEAGGPGRTRALSAISDIGSQTVTSLVAPYSDAQGKPMLSFQQLEPLLHPGDILVWEHRDNGLDKPRTGGHTLTITAVKRNDDGKILSMSFLQGNEPIFGTRCPPGDPDPGGLCAADDDKGQILQQLKLSDTKENRDKLGHAPGRRIEASAAVLSPDRSDYSNPDIELPAAKKGDPTRKVWGWGDKTILLSAGPPRAASRPAMAAKPAKGAQAKGAVQETSISDWAKSFASAGTDADWQAVWESMLLEARAFVEGGRDVPEDQARQTGEAAGKKLWSLAKQLKGTLGDESHFARLRAAKQVIRTMVEARTRGGPTSIDNSSAQDQLTTKLRRTLGWIEESMELAARGASDITFGAGGVSTVKVLLTGFDPFEPSGSLAVPAKGTWNPSGAAVLALDNQSVPAKSSQGKTGSANVQGIILPVDYDQFKAGGQGLVESIVSGKAADLDAAITVSMDPSIQASQPVRLERYVVGTHDVPEMQPQGPDVRKLQPIPAAGQGTAGEGIIESNAPLDQIASETEKKSKGTKSTADDSIPKPNIGENITFRFSTDAAAKTALATLGGMSDGFSPRDITISDATTLHEITGSMVRQTNGIDIAFQAKGRSFTATVVSGPGGNFLSNEVSYRMLRLLKQKNLPQDPLSFHVHTQGANQIPPDTGTPESQKTRADSMKAAGGLLSRLVETLKRIIAATAKVILDRRASKKP